MNHKPKRVDYANWRTKTYKHIPVEITAEEWIKWWLTKNRWRKRGPYANDYCMARINYEQGFTLDNIECITTRERSQRYLRYKRAN